MATFSINTAVLSMNTVSYSTPFLSSKTIKIVTLSPNLVAFSANTKVLYNTTSYYPNNAPTSKPVVYSYANSNVVLLTRPPRSVSVTLLPNLASFSANTKSAFNTTSYYPNNVPVGKPVTYSNANDNILKLGTKSTTLLPNLVSFTSNTYSVFIAPGAYSQTLKLYWGNTVNTSSYTRPVNFGNYSNNTIRALTVTPGTAALSANNRLIFNTRSYYPNNVPVVKPIAYSNANDNILKLYTRSTTLLPNLVSFSANTYRTISYLALNYSNSSNYKLYSNIVYSAPTTYSGGRFISTSLYYSSYINNLKQFWT